MLKLNFYKKNQQNLRVCNRRNLITGFLCKAVVKSLTFDSYFKINLRIGLLFFWTHHSLRKSFFKSWFLKNQCLVTWRTGSIYSFFRLTRLEIRERAHLGFLNGIRKSSW